MTGQKIPLGGGFGSGSKQQPINFVSRDSVVPSRGSNALNFVFVDPLLNGRETDAELESRFPRGEQFFLRLLKGIRLCVHGQFEANPIAQAGLGQTRQKAMP